MPSKPSNVIKIPKPPRSAFNKHRPASRLLLDQMSHLANSLVRHLANLNNYECRTPVTEAHAAEFNRFVTSLLHPHTAHPPARKSKSKSQAKTRTRSARA